MDKGNPQYQTQQNTKHNEIVSQNRNSKIIKIVLMILIVFFLIVLVRNIGKSGIFKARLPFVPIPPQINTSSALVKKIRILVDNDGGRVDWSHVNNLIAFSKLGESNTSSGIYTMNPDGSNQICLTCGRSQIPQLNNDQPAWHPNGEYILFQSADPNLGGLPDYLLQGGAGLNNNLWIMTKDGSRYYQLTHIKSKEASLHPHFSHDGKKVFWGAREVGSSGFGGEWVLKVADFIDDSSNPHLQNIKSYQPLGPKAFYESHSFDTDDQTLIFSASPTTGEYDLDIYSFSPLTNSVQNLTNFPGDWDEHAILSPSGKKIAWISSYTYNYKPIRNWASVLKTDLWLMNKDGSEKEKVTHLNDPNSKDYTGDRIIAADNSWNKEGDKLVFTAAVVGGGKQTRRIYLVEFHNPK